MCWVLKRIVLLRLWIHFAGGSTLYAGWYLPSEGSQNGMCKTRQYDLRTQYRLVVFEQMRYQIVACSKYKQGLK